MHNVCQNMAIEQDVQLKLLETTADDPTNENQESDSEASEVSASESEQDSGGFSPVMCLKLS